MPDFNTSITLPELTAAAAPAEPAPPKTMVAVEIDADVLDWFEKISPMA